MMKNSIMLSASLFAALSIAAEATEPKSSIQDQQSISTIEKIDAIQSLLPKEKLDQIKAKKLMQWYNWGNWIRPSPYCFSGYWRNC